MEKSVPQTINSKILMRMVVQLEKRQGRTVRCGAYTVDRSGMVARIRRDPILDFCVFSEGGIERDGCRTPLLMQKDLMFRLCFSDRVLRDIFDFILKTLEEEGITLSEGDSSERPKT